jgi:hypothetical protein
LLSIDTNLDRASRFKIVNHEPNPRDKIIKSIKNELVFDTESETRKVLMFPFHGNENQRYEIILKDFDKPVYMIAQGTRCLEWCDSCGYFMMNQCNINNINMLYEIITNVTSVSKISTSNGGSNFNENQVSGVIEVPYTPFCSSCEATRRSRCIPCENPRQNTCFSCNSVRSSPLCDCISNRSGGPYW